MTSVSDDDLLAAAREVARRAYSPYSGIRVGAAVLAADGRVFAGCNVENASYGLTICAERSAAVRAVAEGAREFTAVAIVGSPAEPMMPCGACRQFLSELSSDLRVLIEAEGGGARIEATLGELLPRAYGP